MFEQIYGHCDPVKLTHKISRDRNQAEILKILSKTKEKGKCTTWNKSVILERNKKTDKRTKIHWMDLIAECRWQRNMSHDQLKLIRRTFFSVTIPHLFIALGQILKKRKEKKRKGRKRVEKKWTDPQRPMGQYQKFTHICN